MHTFGHLQREKPRIRVYRGWDPQETQSRRASHPVKDGEEILSGMVMHYEDNGSGLLEWVRGGDAESTSLYIAQDDYTDEDVLAAGSLVGLSCSGKFELHTGHYADEVYPVDELLTYDGTTGNITPGTLGTDIILGRVTRKAGPTSIAREDSSAESPLVVIFETELILPQS